MYIVSTRSGRVRDSVVWFGPVAIQLTDGRADITEHPDREFLVQRVQRSANFRIEDSAPITPSTPYPQPEAFPSAGDATPHEFALAQGWSALDLEGTGQDGLWGADGGRSPRTGLSAAEMAICKAPDSWEADAPYAYPWEIEGWHPPGHGWVPPICPAKPTPSPEDIVARLTDEQVLVLAEEEGIELANIADMRARLIERRRKVDEEEDEAVTPAPPQDDDDAPDEDEDDDDFEANLEPAPNSGATAEAPPPAPEAPESSDDGVLEGYGTPEDLAAALEATAALIAAKGGTLPSYNQLRYHLEKVGLPRPGKYERVAILKALGHVVEA